MFQKREPPLLRSHLLNFQSDSNWNSKKGPKRSCEPEVALLASLIAATRLKDPHLWPFLRSPVPPH